MTGDSVFAGLRWDKWTLLQVKCPRSSLPFLANVWLPAGSSPYTSVLTVRPEMSCLVNVNADGRDSFTGTAVAGLIGLGEF
jgi:hypothetical protein